MLSLSQHLTESIRDETLKRVQGDKKRVATQSPRGRNVNEGKKGDEIGEVAQSTG
jgi:hypothetical protein